MPRDDVVWTYSGVRPLYDDGASEAKAATRDYVFDVDEAEPNAPLLSIFGGKITTYRRLSEAVLERLARHFPSAKAPWTAQGTLPGGDFPVQGRADLAASLAADYPFLTEAHAERLARLYGTRARRILGQAKTAADLGRAFGGALTEAELRYLHAEEWARTGEDVLWRRTKLGLVLDATEARAVDDFMKGLAQEEEPMNPHLVAIDQGTTSSRAIVFRADLSVAAIAQAEFPQHFPASGWVEHDPEDLWRTTVATVREAVAKAGVTPGDIAAIGITNQRETTVVWDRTTGQADPPRHRLAGPAHGARSAPRSRPRARGAGHRPHRAAARPVFLRHQDRLDPRPRARRAGRGPSAANSPSARSIASCCGG